MIASHRTFIGTRECSLDILREKKDTRIAKDELPALQLGATIAPINASLGYF